ncbi:hypothetical protein B0H13DRAFT_2553385 [Mycena leptocephala]|nr:hypothetical protein B0H13DRAFT_2553385 [Mycena leptocephala]
MTSISVQGMNVTAACRSIVEFEQLAQSILTRFKLWLSPAGYGSWHTSTERLKKGRPCSQPQRYFNFTTISQRPLNFAHDHSPPGSNKTTTHLPALWNHGRLFCSVQAEIKYTTKSLQVTLQWCLRFHLHALAFVPALGDGWVGFAARQTMSRIIPEFLADKIVGSVMDNRYVRGFLLYQSLDILPGPWLTLFAGSFQTRNNASQIYVDILQQPLLAVSEPMPHCQGDMLLIINASVQLQLLSSMYSAISVCSDINNSFSTGDAGMPSAIISDTNDLFIPQIGLDSNTAVIFLADSENHLRMRSSTQSGCALTQSDAPLTLAGVRIGEAWIQLPLES